MRKIAKKKTWEKNHSQREELFYDDVISVNYCRGGLNIHHRNNTKKKQNCASTIGPKVSISVLNDDRLRRKKFGDVKLASCSFASLTCMCTKRFFFFFQFLFSVSCKPKTGCCWWLHFLPLSVSEIIVLWLFFQCMPRAWYVDR